MHYALELAERGFITIAPDYPSFGEHSWDFGADHGYVSGSMRAIWDNSRAIDVLETMPEVDPQRIACVGHSLGGHSAIFTAVFEPRLRAIVSSCGFTSLEKDDLPSWTGDRYMPRIRTVFANDLTRMPFDFHELLACIAPRPLFISACVQDEDFDVTGVREVVQAVRGVYRLHEAEDCLSVVYPEAPHSFPDDVRAQAWEFLIESTRTVPQP